MYARHNYIRKKLNEYVTRSLISCQIINSSLKKLKLLLNQQLNVYISFLNLCMN